MNTEQQARQRVDETPELDDHSETILYDWPNWDEHMQWIATAPIAEIVDWAETVEQPRKPKGGRPFLSTSPTVKIEVTLPASLRDKLDRIADGNRSAWIRQAIEQA